MNQLETNHIQQLPISPIFRQNDAAKHTSTAVRQHYKRQLEDRLISMRSILNWPAKPFYLTYLTFSIGV